MAEMPVNTEVRSGRSATVHSRTTRAGNLLRRASLHAILIGISLVALVPLVWMLSTSLKASGAEYDWPPVWIPNPIVWANYVRAHSSLNYAAYYRNTATICILSTIGATLTSSMAAYAFARLRFDGRNVLFVLLLSTMMLPGIVTLIPTFVIFKTVGWIDTLLPLVVPSWLGGGAFYIFLVRQFFMTIPMELDESARIDGASSLRIYWQILMPLAGPAVAVVAVFTFVNQWTDFLGPLIYLNTDSMRTVALGIAMNRGFYSVKLNYMMAASMVMSLPIIVLFFAAQRYFIRGIALTGLTGR